MQGGCAFLIIQRKCKTARDPRSRNDHTFDNDSSKKPPGSVGCVRPVANYRDCKMKFISQVVSKELADRDVLLVRYTCQEQQFNFMVFANLQDET